MDNCYLLIGIILALIILLSVYIYHLDYTTPSQTYVESLVGSNLNIKRVSAGVIKSHDYYMSIKTINPIVMRDAQVFIESRHVGNIVATSKKKGITFIILDRPVANYKSKLATVILIN